MAVDLSTLCDPLAINLHRQWNAISSHVSDLTLPRTASPEELVDTLARLLHDPKYTLIIAQKFRPILMVLCAQWLDQHGDEDEKFAALALLVNPHEELFPILSAFIRGSHFSRGPLDGVSFTNMTQLHLRLLAYYRILVACPHAPTLFCWPNETLQRLLSVSDLENGIRWLVVRCHALHLGMSEAQRDELETCILGPPGDIDVAIHTGYSLEGDEQWIDGWLLPVLEVLRVRDARRAMLDEPDFYHYEDACHSPLRLDIERLTHRVADVHGVLLLKSKNLLTPPSSLVSTSSTVSTLRALALRLSLRLPTLLSSPPSGGKFVILRHLASLIHPTCRHQLVTIHLSDTSLDPRSLLGSYVPSTRKSGTFEWQEGVIVKAMRHGLWLILEDIDRASPEVLGALIPLIESLAAHKHIGAPASLEVPGHGKVEAAEDFAVFATRSVPTSSDGHLPMPTFLGCHKFSRVDAPAPTEEELVAIINGKFSCFGRREATAIVRAWSDTKMLGLTSGVRDIGLHELETWCRRIESLLPSDHDVHMEADVNKETSLEHIYPHIGLREEMYLEARDVFFGAGAFSESARAHMAEIARIFAHHLGISLERALWISESRLPVLQVEKDTEGQTTALRVGKTRLPVACNNADLLDKPQRPFAMHRPALIATERISTSITLAEPVLLVGETGTGKTTLVSHIAYLLHKPLVSLNLSHQTESSDLLGGFKPVDTRIPAGELQRQFLELFGRTFSRRKNGKFEDAVRKAVNEGKWKRSVGLWKECIHMALEKFKERATEPTVLLPEDHMHRDGPAFNSDSPRKRRRLAGEPKGVRDAEWLTFAREVDMFDVQHVHGQGKFAFGFVEGPLVQALRHGYWVLLDEINLASPETLECISSILQGPTASIALTEQGSFAPVPRHQDFRLFACMNPATDVGKKDLPPSIRSRFTEIHIPPPDADRETLLAIIHQYIGHCTLADKSAPLDVAEFYLDVKKLTERRELADGSNHRPHFSMRTLVRALTFASAVVLSFGLRRALWEGCLMAFCMALDEKSGTLVKHLAEKRLLAGVKNVRAMMAQIPSVPGDCAERFERIGPFWLESGSLEPDSASEYILTPSVQSKLIDLARVVLTRRFPVLIEGPTSSGKTSAIEYLARRTGHRFVRVNNHEHTDIQEYLGTYVSDPHTGKLIFQDGILVRALRRGEWIVLDELNLAPTDVLEALNRLLDDNRELVIPETHEIIKPHPHFMLFATQNPPGLYAGRKVLSRAFRNRFLEIHFDDVPQSELQTILSERCRIPESYAQRIVSVFRELSKRRQAGRVFESKHGFATLRDLFRWAGRGASSTRQLAENGYMLLAERARRADDKEIVKEVIETVMKERIDTDALYDLQGCTEPSIGLGISVPTSSTVIWTCAMRRLFMLVANALRCNEPVLLVGETGSGKTSVCQLYADATSKPLATVNCHQSTETADLVGSQRPLRNRLLSQVELINEAREALRSLAEPTDVDDIRDVEGMLARLKTVLRSQILLPSASSSLRALQLALQRSKALFEWYDGPLIRAMRTGGIFLLDEISLADDSVLERLNSVLEPARNVVLAERGGFDVEHAQVTAHPGFKMLATMNPGGDYGKKELSPALRNRFTEIWVPQIEGESDLRMIIEKSWRHDSLHNHTDKILAFIEWFTSTIGVSIATLRDILTWVKFTNEVLDIHDSIPTCIVFHHAAHMVFLDGLETSSYMSSWPPVAVNSLRERARFRLEQLVPLGEHSAQAFDTTFVSTSHDLRLGPFGISKGPLHTIGSTFSLQARTTLDNVRRLVRACQLPKPILLEGSPGVGKTSLVAALGNIAGYRVCRINLSDQTDLIDLFGSDFPVEGGRAGEFAWKDAAFLRAMQDGDWVLLDEMNLAPQTVLEGLNAILDHRGTVFIPELGRSFSKHPRFRIFAAQNPLHEGGGRKGLPKSFLDRFTKVHIQALTSEDLVVICRNMFPTLPDDHLRSMVLFNSRLHMETAVHHSFGRDGGPWEFNLRDIIRWATLLIDASALSYTGHPSDHIDTLYLQRFRTETDRIRVVDIFCDVFSLPSSAEFSYQALWTSTTRHHAQFGSTLISRGDHRSIDNCVELQHHLRPLAAASVCITKGWLIILSGNAGVGKSQLVRYLASKAGCRLYEFPVSSGVDTADILGSFEQRAGSGEDGGRFEWVDGPLVRAMKRGDWIVLDNANLCSPSVLDRLNSLCESDGFLVLTERGHVDGEVEVLRPDPQFRLIFTMNPRNGELSRAMRNRAVEIHLPTFPLALQDNIRLLDAIRSPPLPWTSDTQDVNAINFELVRRANSRNVQHTTMPSTAIHSGVLKHDFVASFMLDYIIIQQQAEYFDDPLTSAYIHTLFSVRMLVPCMLSVFGRLKANIQLKGPGENYSPQAFLTGLTGHPLWAARRAIGEALSQNRGVPSSFFLAQPFDFFMNPKLLAGDEHGVDGLVGHQRVLSAAIELFVRVHLFDNAEVLAGSSPSSIFHKSHRYYQNLDQALGPGVSTVFPLYKATMNLAHSILQTLRLDHCEHHLLLLEGITNLIDFAKHLQSFTTGPHFDFTSARTISSWFCDVLATNEALSSSPVHMHVQSLLNEVALASGHGMQEIWRHLVLPEPREGHYVTLGRLDHLVVSLDPDIQSYVALRAEALNVMSLLSMSLAAPRKENDSVVELGQDLEHRITAASSLNQEFVSQYPPQLAIAELEFLWRALSGQIYEVLRQRADFLIKLASQTAHASVARLANIQHHVWTLEAHGDQPSGSHARLVCMIREWMFAVDRIAITEPCAPLSGPGLILRPILLKEILDICFRDQAMHMFESHEVALRLQGTLVMNQCQDQPTDRLDQMLRLWTGMLLVLATCFQETYPLETWKELIEAASHGRQQDLTNLLTRSTNAQLARIIHDRLTPTSYSLDQPFQVEFTRISSLGKAWVNLGLALLELYIPNVPLDPVASQRCTSEFWLNREAETLAQIRMHESADAIITGSHSNPIIRMLRTRLIGIRAKIRETGSILTNRDVDLGSLHALFGEVTPFLTQVLYSTKFDALINDLEGARDGSQSRALIVQATISGFMARLESGYNHFVDIIQPISLALSILKFGLHLLGHAISRSPVNAQLANRFHGLIEFPIMAAIESVKVDISTNSISSRWYILGLIASAYETGLDIAESVGRLDGLYRKLAELWLKDRQDQEQELKDSLSLYRHKPIDHDTQSEADMEEQEFQAMFPIFEDIDERRDEKPEIQSRKTPSTALSLSADDKGLVYRLHLWITSGRHSKGGMNILDEEFQELRTTLVRDVVSTHFDELPHVLDTDSLPYQIFLLSRGMAEWNSDRLRQPTTYNFYHDSNVPEVRKALSVVRTFQQRLAQLIKDWPDQMVLHHLMTRCKAVLQLSLRSPVAKVLSTLEQLILQTEDWEIYSNKENTLKHQQAAISELIVHWRRLELSCWSHLLEWQYSSFCASTSEWWFRLYELVVRGTLAAAADGSTDAYFTEMVPLAEQFMTTGPIGQFSTRVKLLNSFGIYLETLSHIKCASESNALVRASRILRSLHGFYNQFSQSIAHSLAAKRAVLEKELMDYIKLASWKDVNVHALKQSAQRTHRQLFKCVRKFRELLREPVAPILSDRTFKETVQTSHISSRPRPVLIYRDPGDSPIAFPSPSVTSSDGMPHHMLNLSGTLVKFERLLKLHGEPLINFVSFELVDGFAGQISETVTALSSETDAAGGNMHLHKTLMMRKRKAWIDLLQELRRAGLSSRLKPDILDCQQNKVWLLDRSCIICTQDGPFQSILKGEDYLNRLLLSMPELRHSLSSHNNDLTTRELQRAVTFVESGFHMALGARARFSRDYLAYQGLDRTVQRLKLLSASRGIILGARNISSWLAICCKLEHALEEIYNGCLGFDKLGSASSLSHVVLQSLRTHLEDIRQSRQTLKTLHHNFLSIPSGLMAIEEHSDFDVACTRVTSTMMALKRWMTEEPRILHLCKPTLLWLSHRIPTIEISLCEEPRVEGAPHKVVIERLLLVAQSVVSLPHNPRPSSLNQSPEYYAAQCESLSGNISRILAIKSLAQAMDSFTEDLAVCPMQGRLEKLQLTVPFADAYLRLVKNHLLVQAELVKSLFKLSYVLCRVVLSLAEKGFCKPVEIEEDSPGHEGEGGETQDGTGLGAGTGAENVSNQIEDESQVEGLRNEETTQNQPGNTSDGEGVEVGEDFGGNIEDINGDEGGTGSDDESQPEVDDQVGKVDATDAGAIDEKIWGDENMQGESADGQSSKDGSKEQNEASDVAAKEEQARRQPSTRESMEPQPPPTDTAREGSPGPNDEIMSEDAPEDRPADAGKQMDNFVPEAHTLDLPDDLNFSMEGDEQENQNAQGDGMDEDEEGQLEQFPDTRDCDSAYDEPAKPPASPQQELDPGYQVNTEDDTGDTEDDMRETPQLEAEDKQSQPVVPPPDLSAGDNHVQESNIDDARVQSPNDQSLETKNGVQNGATSTCSVEGKETDETPPSFENLAPVVADGIYGNQNVAAADFPTPAAELSPLPNPLHSLGDTLKEIRRRWDEIGIASDPKLTPSQPDGAALPQQVEYQPEGLEQSYDLQALGPARDDRVAKLNDIQITDEEPAPDTINHYVPPMDHQEGHDEDIDIHPMVPMDAKNDTAPRGMAVEAALTYDQINAEKLKHSSPGDETFVEFGTIAASNVTSPDDAIPERELVELAVKKWQESGHSDSNAEEMWRLYDSLTQELSFSLCEQLRLILEPTHATRLRGDYRTGKRLNMKKIIPYIASEYTKDKIWLRRTRPSQREYQVLIALDDSRSMAESRSVHLAYETLALVSKALNRLESGEVAIARFGESFELVHGFEDGMVGDREGEKVIRRFKFEQRKTDVLGLVEASLRVLTQARERRSFGRASNEAADLWQLEVIISDGICQDHDRLRTVLRKAEEQRVMIVFVVIDSLHTHHNPSSDTASAAEQPQNSILSMNQVSYKDTGGGRMELQLDRYLDSFPFQYYVVLRSVEALPDVLSETIKQFFERISEE